MQSKDVPVSYRDKEAQKNISLGSISVDQPDTIEEAIALYGDGDQQKGVDNFLEYAFTAYVIERQRQHRDANRPDKPKTQSNLSKFKQLSQDVQDKLLQDAGLL